MAEPKRYDKPVQVWFGEKVVTIEPIRGLKNIQAFEEAVTQEILGFKGRLEAGAILPSHPSHLLTQSVDVVRLLKLACPNLTDELIDMATPSERLGVLEDATKLNGMGHLTVFFSPSTLINIAMSMRKWSTEIMLKEFGQEALENASPLLDFSATSSALASTGSQSTTTSPSGNQETS